MTACAYGMVDNIDDNLGRVLSKLDELDLAQDTIVLFLTDNGANTDRYDGDMRGRKGSVDEGGVRVPLFVRWPGHIAPGTVVHPIAAHIDLLPTLSDLCRVPLRTAHPVDGMSLTPLLLQPPASWPKRTLFTHWRGRGAARTQRWRATWDKKQWRLYDMNADPKQENDVAEQNDAIVNGLRLAYEAWYEDATQDGFDPIPIPIGHLKRAEVTLPGHEAFLHPDTKEGIAYFGGQGWANDWVGKWTDPDAYPYWEIDVLRGGKYEITLMYVCPEQDIGANVRVEIGGKSIEGRIEKAHDPEPVPSPDRVPRKEVYEKVWQPLTLGTLDLPKGRTRLSVKALSKPGGIVMDLKAVRVRRVGG